MSIIPRGREIRDDTPDYDASLLKALVVDVVLSKEAEGLKQLLVGCLGGGGGNEVPFFNVNEKLLQDSFWLDKEDWERA